MSRKEQSRRKATPVPVFESRFEAALLGFAAKLLETGAVEHRGLKGGAREQGVADFFAARLPGRYSVATGVVVDTYNSQSPQLDVLVFDGTRDFPFSDSKVDGVGVLAAEALLASVEVKSVLTAQELDKSCNAARVLRALRPYGNPLVGPDVGEEDGERKRARYHHSIFAFASDLTEEDWLRKEARRLRSLEQPGEHLIDAIYVFKRGLIHSASDTGLTEDDQGSAIVAYYFSLLNFLQREGPRRPPTPYGEYASLLRRRSWEVLRTKPKTARARTAPATVAPATKTPARKPRRFTGRKRAPYALRGPRSS